MLLALCLQSHIITATRFLSEGALIEYLCVSWSIRIGVRLNLGARVYRENMYVLSWQRSAAGPHTFRWQPYSVNTITIWPNLTKAAIYDGRLSLSVSIIQQLVLGRRLQPPTFLHLSIDEYEARTTNYLRCPQSTFSCLCFLFPFFIVIDTAIIQRCF